MSPLETGPRAPLARATRWTQRVALMGACGATAVACVIPRLGAVSVDAGTDSAVAGSSGGSSGGSASSEGSGGRGGAGSGTAQPDGGRGGAGGVIGQPSGGGHAGRAGAGRAAAGVGGTGGSSSEGGTPAVAGSGGTGGGGQSGTTGGNGGAGASGTGGAGGSAACTPDWGSARDKNGDWSALGSNPGNETNSQSIALQFICRATPAGMTQPALGKGVEGYGCYGTYASGGTRVGFGAESGFYTLLPFTHCQTAWKPVTSGITPLDLAPKDAGTHLYACRGELQNEPYPEGVASGNELGQWVPAATSGYECWTQFHGTDQGRDAGSKLLTTNVEVLVVLP